MYKRQDKNGKNALDPAFDPDNIDIYGVTISKWWAGYLPFMLGFGQDYLSEDGTSIGYATVSYTHLKLVQSDLSAEDWIEEYMKNSAAIREAYRKNEEMLDRHVRCFTRGKERWTRQVADPLISFMFRYITRIQDLGTACELAQSLLEFYEGLGDDVAVMKCLLARAFCCDFLDGIHLEDQVKEDCARASIIYEREFLRLTPEEQSMGLSIYDLEFDRLSNRLKLGDISPALIEEMVEIHRVSQKALDYVVAVDQGYEFNLLLPDFDYYLGFCALCQMCIRDRSWVRVPEGPLVYIVFWPSGSVG